MATPVLAIESGRGSGGYPDFVISQTVTIPSTAVGTSTATYAAVLLQAIAECNADYVDLYSPAGDGTHDFSVILAKRSTIGVLTTLITTSIAADAAAGITALDLSTLTEAQRNLVRGEAFVFTIKGVAASGTAAGFSAAVIARTKPIG